MPHRDDFASALRWADRAIALDDTVAALWSARAHYLRRLGQLDDATVSARRALTLDPHDWLAHVVLACVLARRNGPGDAIRGHFRSAIAQRPELADDPDLHALLAKHARGDLRRDKRGTD